METLTTSAFSNISGGLRMRYLRGDGHGRFCSTALLGDRAGRPIELDGFGTESGHADGILVPSDTSFTVDADETIVMCDAYADEMTPHPLCARSRLSKFLAESGRANTFSLTGAELEFFAVPAASWQAFQAGELRPSERALYAPLRSQTLRAVKRILEIGHNAGLSWFGAEREYHPMQFEFSLGPVTPLLLADQIQVARELIVREMERVGHYVTFLPQPTTDGPGNGMHLSIDTDAYIANTSGMSQESAARRLAEGASSYASVLNPTINSYRRLNNSEMRCVKAVSMDGRRDSVVRCASGKSYAEVRSPDMMSNPYLALLILISAIESPETVPVTQEGPLPVGLPESIERLLQLGDAAERLLGSGILAAVRTHGKAEIAWYDRSVTPADFERLEAKHYSMNQSKEHQ